MATAQDNLRRPATIRDVAKRAAVSPTTASDALRGTGRVSAETRARVASAARQLGYRPSRTARSLRAGRQGLIGVSMPPLSDLLTQDYYIGLLAGAARAAIAEGAALVLLPSGEDDDVENAFAGLVDGAIVADPVSADPRLALMRELGIPAVTIDRDLSRPEEPWWVASDNAANAAALLEHMFVRGARRTLLISGAAEWSWFAETENAYRAWVNDRGFAERILRLDVANRRSAAAEAVSGELGRSVPPDAVLCTSELYAVGALEAASDGNLTVPDELQIAALVDGAGARGTKPPITAMDLCPEAQSAAAVAMLIGRLEGSPQPAPVVLAGELHLRGTTK